VSDSWDEDGDDTQPCPYCGAAIHEEAIRCPHCENYLSEEDAPKPSPRGRHPVWIIVLAVVLLLLLCWQALRPF
jgi:predicted nucleic acid-binding Zn ribbon protein